MLNCRMFIYFKIGRRSLDHKISSERDSEDVREDEEGEKTTENGKTSGNNGKNPNNQARNKGHVAV